MIPVERRQIILEMVAEKGIVSIAELTDRMNVSHMTIRRDLQNWSSREPLCWCPEASIFRDAWRMNLIIGKNCAGNDAKSGYWQAGGKSCSAGKLSIW